MEKTINRTLLNGRKYEFVEWMIFGHTTVSTYCEWDGKMNHIGMTFNNLEEAEKWCDERDYEYLHPVVKEEVPFTVPDDYYGVRGRYYGD